MKSYVIVIILLFLLFIVVGNIVEADSKNQVIELKTTIPEDKRLIPKTAVLGINDINEVYLCYYFMSDNLNLYGYKISVSAIKINGKPIDTALFNINLSVCHVEAGLCYVNIMIYLSEPANKYEYETIRGGTITFVLEIDFKH